MALRGYNPFGEIEEQVLIACAAVVSTIAIQEWDSRVRQVPRPLHTRPLTGRGWIREMLDGHDDRAFQNFRMRPNMLRRFVRVLTDHGLTQTRYMDVEEQVCMFLYAFTNGYSNRVIQESFQHSAETISRHIRNVLAKILMLEQEYIRLAPPVTPSRITADPRYYPYFKGVIGAIDGTYIPAHVDPELQGAYRYRKLFPAQNVMVAVDFNLCFTYVVTGWEGSCADMTVLRDSVERGSLLVPQGCKYLVDCGYANTDTFLTPYRGSLYHLSAWRARGCVYDNHKDLFNHRHAKLHNVVERTFGVWKNRFSCLRHMPSYPFEVQRDVVRATCIIHNFVRFNGGDVVSDEDAGEEMLPEEVDEDQLREVAILREDIRRGELLRDRIARAME